MKVRFTDPTEFLAEMQLDLPPSKIVRFACHHQPSPVAASVQSVTVLATFLNSRNQIVELRRFVGEDWGAEFEESQATRQRADEIRRVFEQVASDLGIEIRRGVYEL